MVFLFESNWSEIDSRFPEPPSIKDVESPDNSLQCAFPFIAYSGERIYCGSNGLTVISVTSDGIGYKTPIVSIDSAKNDGFPVLGPDELSIYWSTDRTDGDVKGGRDIWTATRSSESLDFDLPHPIVELNTSQDESPAWISMDSCEMYLIRFNADSGTDDIYVAKRPL